MSNGFQSDLQAKVTKGFISNGSNDKGFKVTYEQWFSKWLTSKGYKMIYKQCISMTLTYEQWFSKESMTG